jgi:hypothetical protein
LGYLQPLLVYLHVLIHPSDYIDSSDIDEYMVPWEMILGGISTSPCGHIPSHYSLSQFLWPSLLVYSSCRFYFPSIFFLL